jgi:hypothetical protein
VETWLSTGNKQRLFEIEVVIPNKKTTWPSGFFTDRKVLTRFAISEDLTNI